jgi:hypothetical protein
MNLLREKLRARGHHRLYCSDAPDTSGINAAAAANAEIAKEALAWYKDEYARTAPQRAAASGAAMEQAALQNDLAKQQLQTTSEERQRYKTTFQPLEQQIVADAAGYDTPARREAEAAAAAADVERLAGAQRQATMRSLERRGALPSSGRVMAMSGMMDIAAAKAKAGAANTARKQVETVGAAKRADAAALGRGVVSQGATAAQIGLQAGNSSAANAAAPVGIAASGAGLMGQGFQTGISGNNSAGSLYAQQSGIQQKANDSSGVWGALGSVAGAALSNPLLFTSDEEQKEGVKPASDDAALEAVRKTPNKVWRYKEDSPAADGGQTHVGPMAQKVAATMGMDAAPAGKAIDPITMNGVMMGAVRALDKKLSKVVAAAGLQLA